MHTLKFLALSMLTLSVGLAADHPITISNGSPLILEHDSWNSVDDHHLGTVVHDNKVTYIKVTSNGQVFGPIDVRGAQLNMHLTYSTTSGGTIVLDLVSGPQGQDPVLTVDGNASLPNDFSHNGNQFVSKKDVSITGLTIKKGIVDVTPAGPFLNATKVAIHYE